jgi:hypothetical protein
LIGHECLNWASCNDKCNKGTIIAMGAIEELQW